MSDTKDQQEMSNPFYNRNDPTTTTSSPSLLERLRDDDDDDNKNNNKLVDSFHSRTDQTAAKESMLLLIHHQREFPISIQKFIIYAESRWSSFPERFVTQVYNCARRLLRGCELPSPSPSPSPETKTTKKSSNDWQGLDSKVDTQDQVELVIRLFPDVLTEAENYYNLPIYRLVLRPQTVAFVPIVLKMHRIQRSIQSAGVFAFSKQLVIPGRETFRELFGKDHADFLYNGQEEEEANKNHDHDDDHDKKDELERESLLALANAKEMGLLPRQDDIDSLIKWVLSKVDEKGREIAFIETRIRLLIGWKPCVLKELRKGIRPEPLLHIFWRYCGLPCDKPKSLEMRLFRVIFELGLKHYPKDLGFVYCHHAFDQFARRWGIQPITQILYNQLLLMASNQSFVGQIKSKSKNKSNNSSNNKRLQSLLVAAATNDNICLDGIYTLLRFNPVSFLPEIPGNACEN
eukprot:CAMPEP_0116140522 /NCGR_PEP_ID=MMETSP0329-20121206/13895_1 /TAXON_ID=697910 /ORGANISM="Pseudo-nitzschia arenysensis, Strain B593" /LENGTH=460 /DNA_ID=CAMNT_0003635647 /DNA_START=220 /DNA_END=1602 /DNA_ORIENTATION=-